MAKVIIIFKKLIKIGLRILEFLILSGFFLIISSYLVELLFPAYPSFATSYFLTFLFSALLMFLFIFFSRNKFVKTIDNIILKITEFLFFYGITLFAFFFLFRLINCGSIHYCPPPGWWVKLADLSFFVPTFYLLMTIPPLYLIYRLHFRKK